MTVPILKAHFILYVKNQATSTAFYEHVLNQKPSLNVPGMTEFTLSDGYVLGIMPVTGINRLLGERLFNPDAGDGIPRAELYLLVNEPLMYHRRALKAGAIELSKLSARDWGHRAAYSLDLNGYVLAFAEPIETA